MGITSPTILFSIPQSISTFIESTILISNILANNLFLVSLNNYTLSSQRHGRELANLIKIYIDEAKFNSENNNFTFKSTIFYDICSKANICHKIELKTFIMM